MIVVIVVVESIVGITSQHPSLESECPPQSSSSNNSIDSGNNSIDSGNNSSINHHVAVLLGDLVSNVEQQGSQDVEVECYDVTKRQDQHTHIHQVP